MNAATRGVILAVAAVVLGVIVLGQGFDDPTVSVDAAAPVETATPEPTATPEGSGEAIPTPDGSGETTDPAEGGETTDPGEGGETTDPGDGTDGGDTTPPVLHDPSEVRVLVVNGTTTSGAAGTVNNELIALGYNGLSPTNTNPIGAAEATKVYYADGFELDARQLAQSLNAPATSVEPLPEDVPVDDLQEAHVVIILGPDLVSG